MPDETPAKTGDDLTPDDTATVDQPDSADDPNPEGGDDTAVDTPADKTTDDDPDAGIHPDALDPDDDEEGDEPDLSDDEIKDSSRLQKRFKSLSTKAKKAKDLEIQNNQLLQEIERLKTGKPPKEKESPEKPDADEEFTPEQLAQAEKLFKKLGYAPASEVDSLKKSLKKLTTDKAQEADQKSMQEAITRFADEKTGKPIVTERHIKNAMRKWMQHPDPSVRARVNMDYEAMIQLIGGSRLSKAPAKKKPAPEVPGGKGGGEQPYRPEERGDSTWNPADPIGSEQRSISRILSALDE